MGQRISDWYSRPPFVAVFFVKPIVREFIDSLGTKSLSVNHEHLNDEAPLRSDED